MKKLWRLAIGIAILVMYLVAAALWLNRPEHAPRIYIELPAAEKQRLAARHAYHGISCSIEDENGRRYFYREGKKCKL